MDEREVVGEVACAHVRAAREPLRTVQGSVIHNQLILATRSTPSEPVFSWGSVGDAATPLTAANAIARRRRVEVNMGGRCGHAIEATETQTSVDEGQEAQVGQAIPRVGLRRARGAHEPDRTSRWSVCLADTRHEESSWGCK